MSRPSSVLLEHLRRASRSYALDVAQDARWVLVHDFALPAGYNAATTEVLVGIAPDYPLRPPGLLPHGIFLTPGLRYYNAVHPAIVEDYGPGWGRWDWLCLVRMAWDPHRDDLIRCLEIARVVLSNPAGA